MELNRHHQAGSADVAAFSPFTTATSIINHDGQTVRVPEPSAFDKRRAVSIMEPSFLRCLTLSIRV